MGIPLIGYKERRACPLTGVRAQRVALMGTRVCFRAPLDGSQGAQARCSNGTNYGGDSVANAARRAASRNGQGRKGELLFRRAQRNAKGFMTHCKPISVAANDPPRTSRENNNNKHATATLRAVNMLFLTVMRGIPELRGQHFFVCGEPLF